MNENLHLHALTAQLTVGPRSPKKLAREATIVPKVATDEIMAIGDTVRSDVTKEELDKTRVDMAAAVKATAQITRYEEEQQAHEQRRADRHGPHLADGLWLNNLVAILIVITILAIGGVLVVHGFHDSGFDALLALSLATVVAAVAGDWIGRANGHRAAKAAGGLIAIAIAASFAVGVLHHRPPILYAVDLSVILTAAVAGYLVGRGRSIHPRIRAEERQHAVRIEIANARPAVNTTAEIIAAHEANYAALIDQIAAIVIRAVEEYLRRIHDEHISNGLLDNVTADHLRTHSREVVANWPRSLGLTDRLAS